MKLPLQDDPELQRLADAFLVRAKELGALAGLCMAVSPIDGYTRLGGEFYDDVFGALVQQFASLRQEHLDLGPDEDDAEGQGADLDAAGSVH